MFSKANHFPELKQLNRVKATFYLLEELKQKSEDNFGNSSGDKSTKRGKVNISKRRNKKNSFLKAKPAKLPNIKKTTRPDKIPVKVVIMLAYIIDKHII